MPLKRLVESQRFREAFEFFHSSETAVDRQDPDQQLLAANAATRLGELGAGQQLATSAFERFASGEDQVGVMQASNLLGAIAFERGRMSMAQAYYSRSIQLARLQGNWAMLARVSNNLATLIHIRGGAEAAIPLFREAAGLFQGVRDARGGAEADHNLGLLFHELDRNDEAYEAASNAVQLAEKTHDRSLQALTLLGLAEITIDKGDISGGQQKMVRGAALAAEASDQLNGIEAGRLRALLTYRRGDYAVAHHLAEVAASIAGTLGSALLRAECVSLASLALRAQGRTRDAEVRREEALAAFAGFGARVKVERFEREWSKAAPMPTA
jgi:tetratricopeptide (TPR) repeat protein